MMGSLKLLMKECETDFPSNVEFVEKYLKANIVRQIVNNKVFKISYDNSKR